MSDVGLGAAKPVKKAKQRKRSVPQQESPVDEPVGADRYESAQPVDSRTGHEAIPDDWAGKPVVSDRPVNPYAPTGWRKKTRLEFDVELPSGQKCRVIRLERDDLLKMNLLQELDTFTPMLLDDSMSDAEREGKAATLVKENPEALKKMLSAIDKVVLAATVAPKITEDPRLVDYGNESNWADESWVGTVLLDDIDTFERMYIFGAAFGRDMDDLKSVLEQTQSVDSLADVSVVSQAAK